MNPLGQNGRLGSLLIKNRIVMPAMGTNFAGADGGITSEIMAYYVRRSTGPGLIILESSTVDHPYGSGEGTEPRVDEDRYVPGLATLAEAIKNHGARSAIQLNHKGKTRAGGMAPLGMHDDELNLVCEKFVSAALRAKEAGFDAIELHYAHSYLMPRFLSRAYNSRDDDYGGSLENRLRFPLRVLERVRAAVGSLPVMVRINGKEFLQNGIELDESILIAQALEAAGADAIDVSCGPGKSRYSLGSWMMPEGWRVPYAEAIKKAVSVPVVGGGCIRTPEFAADVIGEGKIDYVAIGRSMIADPDWAQKALAGKHIRPCIGCNCCVKRRVFSTLPLRCTVNPEVGWEWKIEGQPSQAEKKKKVCVVGGGPAGLTTALTASRRGHEVTLLEEQTRLGGQAVLAALPPGKEKIGEWLMYLTAEVEDSDIDLRLGASGDVFPSDLQCDVVILATGSRRVIPSSLKAYGGTSIRMVTAEECFDILDMVTGKHIVVVGGGEVGCELALTLAHRDARVTLVEMLHDIACDLDPITRETMKEELGHAGVTIKTSTCFRDIREGLVVALSPSGEESLETDMIVFCIRGEPRLPPWVGRDLPVIEAYCIGDSKEPANIFNATTEGYWLGYRL